MIGDERKESSPGADVRLEPHGSNKKLRITDDLYRSYTPFMAGQNI